MFAAAVKAALEGVRRFGPYAAIEILLPGGSVLAILLWLYRRHRARLAAVSAEAAACAVL